MSSFSRRPTARASDLRLAAAVVLSAAALVAATVTVTPAPDTTTVLRNPGMGFTTYVTPWGVEQFGWASEAFGYAGVRETCNIVYLRCKWADLEPREGDYVWQNNQSFKDLVQGVKDNDARLAFRVMVQEDGNATPPFVLDAIRAAGGEPFFPEGRKYPAVTHPVWQEKFRTFITAFGKALDDPALVDYIDANGLGLSGEGNLSGIPEAVQEAYYDGHLSLYNEAFKQVLLNVTFAMFWPTPLEIDERLAIGKYAMLMRRDGLGSAWVNDREIAFMQRHYPRTALIGENCYSFGDSPGTGWWVDAAVKRLAERLGEPVSLRVYMKLILEQAIAMHANTMTFQFREAKDWFANPDLLALAVANLGYRLRPTRVEYPDQVGALDSMTVTHLWTNDGVGVLPNANPRWNRKYALALALFGADAATPAQVFIDRSTDPGVLVKGTDTPYATQLRWGVPAGSYRLAIGILDQTQPARPPLALAIKGQERRSGWYLQGALTVVAAPPAGEPPPR